MRRVLKLIPKHQFSVVQASCCGMAGPFGLESEHADMSPQMAEEGLFPALRQGPVLALSRMALQSTLSELRHNLSFRREGIRDKRVRSSERSASAKADRRVDDASSTARFLLRGLSMSCAQSELFIHQPSFLAPDESAELFSRLSVDLPWQSEFTAFGRCVSLPRHQVWYAEAHVDSRYSANNLLPRQNFSPVLRVLKRRVEARCGRTFNSLLATLYRDGNDHVGYHADDDEELGPRPLIASLSLGGTRRFWFRPKLPTPAQAAHPIALNGGDLLLMLPLLQRDWEHAVLAEPDCHEARINLTFRCVN